MTIAPEPLLAHAELGSGLAWLRARARLTQRQVVERVQLLQRNRPQAERETLSEVYYQALETGKRRPRLPKLEAILAALASDREELAGLLATAPWTHEPESRARISKHTPRPAVYAAAAEQALAGGVWSSPVAVAATDGAGARRRGELAELVDHFEQLSPADRAALLADARVRRWGGRDPRADS